MISDLLAVAASTRLNYVWKIKIMYCLFGFGLFTKRTILTIGACPWKAAFIYVLICVIMIVKK